MYKLLSESVFYNSGRNFQRVPRVYCNSDDSQSPAGSGVSTSCICNAGAQGPDGGTCALCVAGKYKISTGSVTCTNCLVNQFSITVGATSNVCQGCTANSQSPAGSGVSTSCICNAGAQGPDGGTCALCVAGKYKISAGSVTCTNCLVNQFSITVGATSNVCQGCVTNSQSPAGSGVSTSCICNAGAEGPDGGSCALCVAGKYKISTGNAACTNCLAGQYSTAVQPLTCAKGVLQIQNHQLEVVCRQAVLATQGHRGLMEAHARYV